MEIKKVHNSANSIMVRRTTIRKYDASHKIARNEMRQILQDAMTAPSSLNLQPWRFVVIDTDEGKKSIEPYIMFNQQQLATSSAMIAVFGDKENLNDAESIYSAYVDQGLMSESVKDQKLGITNSLRKNITNEAIINVLMFDCGLVSMQIMLSATAYGYDTNAIGGFDKAAVGKVLGMDAERYIPVLLLAIGKPDQEASDSIRYSVDEITQWK